jgi:hypothetical protein
MIRAERLPGTRVERLQVGRWAIALAALALSAALPGRAHANAVGRIYIKHTDASGKKLAAWALDPSGNLQMGGNPQYWAVSGGWTMTGFVVKNNGTPLYAVKEPSTSNPTQFGQFLIGYNNIGDQIPSLPTGTGSLVMKSNGTARLEFATQSGGGYVAISQLYYAMFSYRKDAHTLSSFERTNYQDALVNMMKNLHHPGTDGACATTGTGLLLDGTSFTYHLPGGVSYFAKFDETHTEAFVHGGNFLPWHREMLRRFEDQLRMYDPTISIPYWDWNTSPIDLLAPDFLGVYAGYDPNDPGIGEPFRSAGFYDPTCVTFCVSNPQVWTSGTGGSDPCSNPACGATNGLPGGACRQSGRLGGPYDYNPNPAYNSFLRPQYVYRDMSQDNPNGISYPNGPQNDDYATVHGSDAADPSVAFNQFATAISYPHSVAHDYFTTSGTLSPLDTAARDPFFYVMHSNVDRIWASWQVIPGRSYRQVPGQVYGSPDMPDRMQDQDTSFPPPPLVTLMPMDGITSKLEPWADSVLTELNTGFSPAIPFRGYRAARPWTTHCSPAANCTGEGPDPAQMTSFDPSIVTPPLYDYYINTCSAPYDSSLCTNYVPNCLVTLNNHNYVCANSNCTMCASDTRCAPGGVGCPAGTVWTDAGTCG